MKRRIAPAIIVGVAAALSLGSAGCRRAEAPAPEAAPLTPVQALAARLDSVAAARRIIFGHHDDPVYGTSWQGDRGRSDVLALTGDYPGMMSWDIGLIEEGDTVNLDGVPFGRMREEVAAQAARGGINTFSWHPRNPLTGGDSWDVSSRPVPAAIMADSALSAQFDGWCSRVAGFFLSLTDSAGARIPVIFRPWHEHTGSWFWWGREHCSPEEYRALWTRLRAACDSAGVDNVLWAYSPDRVDSYDTYMERYPGDGYVDIMGTDVYHFGGEEGIAQYQRDLERSLGIAMQAAAAHRKPLALTETGSEGVVVADWYTRVLLPVVSAFPVSYVVVWRNAPADLKPGHFYVPYPGHPAEADFRAFAADTTIILARGLADKF